MTKLPPVLRNHIKPFIPYFERGDVVELCINKPGEIWLETNSGWECIKDDNFTLQALNKFASILATNKGQKFDHMTPILSTDIPIFGYRVQIAGSSLIDSGFSLSMRIAQARRFSLSSYTFVDEIDNQAEKDDALKAIEAEKDDVLKIKKAVKQGCNILVVGGTSSGKTTLVNSLIQYIPNDQRIVCVEDTKELVIDQPNKVRFLKSKTGTDLASISYKDIINSTMRMRPDRILLGELDIENTLPFLRLLNTGHAGCLATLHADSAEQAIDAMVMNAQMAGIGGSRELIEEYSRKSLDLIIFVHRIDRGTYHLTVTFIK